MIGTYWDEPPALPTKRSAMPAHQVNFVDFHESFSPKSNSLLNSLLPYFDLKLSDKPDFLFYSVFGFNHTDPRFNRCIKIWCTEENFRPDFTRCDYALSFDHLPHEPRNLRLPLYVRYLYHHQQRTGRNLVKPPGFDAASILQSKTRFCNFIYSNPGARTRIDFFLKLSRYKRVDSGGAILNNLGYRPSDKLKFISPYKFTMAFENTSWPGYVTEKLVEPMLVDSLPIYWGHPSVREEFNPHSFVNCHDFSSLDEAMAEIIRLDKDDQAYVNKLNQPWFENNTENQYCKPDYLVPFFSKVFADKPHEWDKWANVKPINYATEHRTFM